MNTWSKLMTAIQAFREAYVSADFLNETAFGDFGARRLRYDIYWAMYENTAYRDLHKWSTGYKNTYGLYKYIRNIYNPAYRIGEFWKAHLMGGALDLLPGDGKQVPSALPITTKNPLICPAIGKVWRWSNWQTKKDVFSLYGAIMGDVALKVVDRPDAGRVYLQVVHPSTIKELDLDDFGNVKGYTLEEERPDPRKTHVSLLARQANTVKYQEIAYRDGGNVVYRTLLNGEEYPWDGETASWTEPYGFVPFVFAQHNNVGLSWGWSELHPDRSKFHEADDLASKLSDYIRKMVDAPLFFSGVDKPSKDSRRQTSGSDPTSDRPQPGREEIPALYGPQGSSVTPMVANLDISSTSNHIDKILKDVEKDYPELVDTLANISGDISGRALRLHREPIVTKVAQRRGNYDDALVRAQQMALTIGGLRGLEGFQSFGLDAYEKGELDHSIGNRPVFDKDPLDDLEYDKTFWDVATSAQKAGMPLDMFLSQHGWTKEQVDEFKNSPEYIAKVENAKTAALLGQQLGGNPDGNQQPA